MSVARSPSLEGLGQISAPIIMFEWALLISGDLHRVIIYLFIYFGTHGTFWLVALHQVVRRMQHQVFAAA